MLKNLDWPTWSVDNLNNALSKCKQQFLEVHIGALHNIVRRIESAHNIFRQLEAVDIMQKFRKLYECPVCFVLFVIIQPRNRMSQ